jgi:hypothetical protein
VYQLLLIKRSICSIKKKIISFYGSKRRFAVSYMVQKEDNIKKKILWFKTRFAVSIFSGAKVQCIYSFQVIEEP